MSDWHHDLAGIPPFAEVDYSGRFDEAFCDPLRHRRLSIRQPEGVDGSSPADGSGSAFQPEPSVSCQPPGYRAAPPTPRRRRRRAAS